jgi:hypothetical protein
MPVDVQPIAASLGIRVDVVDSGGQDGFDRPSLDAEPVGPITATLRERVDGSGAELRSPGQLEGGGSLTQIEADARVNELRPSLIVERTQGHRVGGIRTAT